MDLYFPRYAAPGRDGLIPPSPAAERRERLRRQVAREIRYPVSGRVLQPGMPYYEETLRAVRSGMGSGTTGGMQSLTGLDTQLLGVLGGGGLSIPAPTVFYRLDDLNDSVGSLALTNNNAATFVGGQIGNGADFVHASSQYLSHANNTAYDNPTCIWFWGYIKNTGTQYPFVSHWNAFVGDREWEVNIVGSSPYLARFQVSNDGTAITSQSASTFGALAINTWYFICARYDGANLKCGVNLTENSTAYSSGIHTGSALFAIGADYSSGSAAGFLNGRVDALAIFKGANITDAQVTAGYNGGLGTEWNGSQWI